MMELLQMGIPWEVVDSMPEKEVTLILAFKLARKERETEAMASREADMLSRYRS